MLPMLESRLLRTFTTVLVALLLALVAGCTGAQARAPSVPAHDQPVPPSEPRAEVVLVVDLEASQGCEERFDLALYQDRRVDLIQWDAARGSCAGRQVTIRYLSAQLDRTKLLGLVRKLVLTVRLGEDSPEREPRPKRQ
ncbi:MAG: hypothetical protein DRI90_07075 [Deltaproteobacteria bacterium]|nr:MAG: hypothetical protein DRI90_07075 [Deltaproteobacteria bacterium]